ncbi:hypothetical protein B296_00037642 [Ensete ventricosum]|uniref:Uncharacterized protein n=1 Tax=Ensete ventricosum TaxID=4639 RepID=A0A426XI01_ENSVE|nr:hypothetical protein B296_00037642 [Ensete ventricosum]
MEEAKGNCLESTGVLMQVVERGEEVTTSLEGLSCPKVKRQSERRWTRRNAIVPRERDRGGGECKVKLQVSGQDRRAKAKELHKTSVNGLLIKIAKCGGLRVDAGMLDQGTKLAVRGAVPFPL